MFGKILSLELFKGSLFSILAELMKLYLLNSSQSLCSNLNCTDLKKAEEIEGVLTCRQMIREPHLLLAWVAGVCIVEGLR